MSRLLALIMEDKPNTTFLIGCRMSLEEQQRVIMFKERQNEFTKVILKPQRRDPALKMIEQVFEHLLWAGSRGADASRRRCVSATCGDR